MFCIPKRRHGLSNDMSRVEYKKQYFQRLSSAWKSRGDSYFDKQATVFDAAPFQAATTSPLVNAYVEAADLVERASK